MVYLCIGRRSATPYYIEGSGIGIYSFEELAYYIRENLLMLDTTIMDDRLCNFMDRELGLTDLADKLSHIINSGGSLTDFVEAFFFYTHFASVAEIENMKRQLASRGTLSKSEKYRMKGDFLIKGGKYTAAVNEYNMAYDCVDEEQRPKEAARILHNKGVAFARMFYFSDAAECFKRAYELNPTSQSSKEQYDSAVQIMNGYIEGVQDNLEGTAYRKYYKYKKRRENEDIASCRESLDELIEELENSYRKSFSSF